LYPWRRSLYTPTAGPFAGDVLRGTIAGSGRLLLEAPVRATLAGVKPTEANVGDFVYFRDVRWIKDKSRGRLQIKRT
jgi:hypothetical protein